MISTPANLAKAALGIALAVIGMALGVLVGWSFNIPFLKSLIPGYIPTNPVTAIGFILAGSSLALSLHSLRCNKRRTEEFLLAARLCALVVALIGLVKLYGYQSGVDLRFDRWLFAAQVLAGGRPIAPNAALNFLLLGVALLIVNVKRRSVRTCVALLIGVALCDSLVAGLGYVYEVRGFYSFGGMVPMSIYTTILFLLLSLACLLSLSGTGLLAIVTGKSASGSFARRLIAAAILVPSCFGWLELHGELDGLFDSRMGNALFSVAYILIFTLLICWSVLNLSRVDLERERAKQELFFNQERYRSLVEATASMVWQTPPSGEFEVAQPGWTAFTGQSFEELRGWGWLNAVHPDDRAETKRVWSAAFAGRSTYKVEHRIMARDGTYRDMMVSAVPVFAADGTISQWFGVHTDITKRKQGEESLRLLNSAVVQSKESILITDADLDFPGPRIIFANPAFTTLTGYTTSEVLGQTPRILQGPKTDKAVLKRLRECLTRGEAFEGEAINYRKDGSTYKQEWQIAPISDANGKTTHFVASMRDITERKRMDARFRLLVDSNVQGVLFWSRHGGITGANDAFLRLVHHTREDLESGRINWQELTPPQYTHLDQRALEEIDTHGFSSLYEKEFLLKDGTRVPVLLGAAAYADSPDEGVCFVLDLTDRKALEARLFQAQKMETVGKLAGGVAHEFNSILTAIIGQSELLLGELPAESSEANSAREISQAAIRAANLTRQLLAYGRKQLLEPQLLDLNSVLGDMDNTLRQVLGPQSDLRIIPADGLKTVQADAGQIEQVIMNMVLNAREAMPNGGKVTLETANIFIVQGDVGTSAELKTGDYVMIAITDTGSGMTADMTARIFEPFFSTKRVGEGAGLGLSTSYGIIKQSGGHISVYSEPSHGTTFKIYLPQVDGQAALVAPPLPSSTLPRGTETILLAEDDPALRRMATTLLEKLGYLVLTAADGVEALSLNQLRDFKHIDLLFTDVVMPHMSGKELSERLQKFHPEAKILFTSAYTENAIVHQGVLDKGVSLLQKPFTPSALARKVREVLDQ